MAQLTIRSVPDGVRDMLASRAAARRQSMQEYVLSELERIAAVPSIEEWLDGVRQRKALSETRIGAADILGARDEDRK